MVTWNACCKGRDVKRIAPDGEMAASLIKTSSNKADANGQLPLTRVTIAAKISLGYDVVRELLEALALQEGFKIYTRVCYTAFLEEFLKKGGLAEEFDEIRRVRNDVNYYGKDVALEEAETILRRMGQLRHLLIRRVE